jgi:hypothetical protein
MRKILLLVWLFSFLTTIPLSAQTHPRNLGNARPHKTATLACGTYPHCVSVLWSNATQVDGNTVYRGTVTGGPYTAVSALLSGATSWQDNDVTAGTTYFYVVTATVNGTESAYSTEASAVVPTP